MSYISAYSVRRIVNPDGENLYIPSPCFIIREIRSEKRRSYQIAYKTNIFFKDNFDVRSEIKDFNNFDDINDVINADKVYENYDLALAEAQYRNEVEASRIVDKTKLINYKKDIKNCLEVSVFGYTYTLSKTYHGSSK